MVNKTSLAVNRELAEGSFGSVYSIANSQCCLPIEAKYVYKEYKEYANPDAESLSAFASFYQSLLSTGDRNYLDSICCWPHELVMDKGKVSGFLMIQIPGKFYYPINFSAGPKVMEAKFEHLLLPKSLLERRQIQITKKTRYKLLLSVVRGLNFFHEHGICIGDFSHSNILFSLNDCSVFFLDCDSFSLKGSTVFPQTETGNWGVAERYPGEELGTKASDIYKLGLLALRLLMKSDNPAHYQASTNTDRLPKSTDVGIRAVIEDSLKDAASRPTLARWIATLDVAIVNCANEPKAERKASPRNKYYRGTNTPPPPKAPASGKAPPQNRASRGTTARLPTTNASTHELLNVFPLSADLQSSPANSPTPLSYEQYGSLVNTQTQQPSNSQKDSQDNGTDDFNDRLGVIAFMIVVAVVIFIILALTAGSYR